MTKYTIIDTRMMVQGHINKVLKQLRNDEREIIKNLKTLKKHLKFEKKLIELHNNMINRLKDETKNYMLENNLTSYVTDELINITEVKQDVIAWHSTWHSSSDTYPSDVWNDAAKWCAKNINHDNDIVRNLAKFGLDALKHRTEDAVKALFKVRAK